MSRINNTNDNNGENSKSAGSSNKDKGLSLNEYKIKAQSLLKTFNENRKQAIQNAEHESKWYRMPSRTRWNHIEYADITADELAGLFNDAQFTQAECDVVIKTILQYAGLYCGYKYFKGNYDAIRNYSIPDKTMLRDALHYYKKTNDITGFKILLKLINDDNMHSFLLTDDEYAHIIRNNIDNGKLKAFLDNSNLKTNKNSMNKITLTNGRRTPLQNIIHNWLYPSLADRTLEFLPGGTVINADNKNANMNYDNIIAFITKISKARISKMNLTRKGIMDTYIQVHDKLGLEGDEYCIQLAEKMAEPDNTFTEFNYDYIIDNHEYPVEFIAQSGSIHAITEMGVYYDMRTVWNEKTNKPENTDDGSSTYLADCMSDFMKTDAYENNYEPMNYNDASNTFGDMTGLMNEGRMRNLSNALINIGNMPDWLVLELNRLKKLRINNRTQMHYDMPACSNVQDYQLLWRNYIEKYRIISGFRNILRNPDTAGRFLIYHEIAMFIACNEKYLITNTEEYLLNNNRTLFKDIVCKGRIQKTYFIQIYYDEDVKLTLPDEIVNIIGKYVSDYKTADKIKTLIDNDGSISRSIHDDINEAIMNSNNPDLIKMLDNYNTYYDGHSTIDNSWKYNRK